MRTAAFIAFLLLSTLATSAQSDIHSVDFKNFTYSAYCASEDPQNIKVKDAEYSKETPKDGYVDRIWFKAFSIKYGDLNGDGKDEAVILSVCNTGGTGNFSEGYIYSMKAGKPTLLARIPGGDRAYGGLTEASVDNGVLIVERNDVGETGAACCPESILTEHYKLAGSQIVEIGKPSRRPFVPTERVQFVRGTSGSTFKVAIPAGESKRYLVGARGGQILIASVSSDKVTVRLLEEADVTNGVNTITAKLPKSGDYTVEVENTASLDMEVTVNIRVR